MLVSLVLYFNFNPERLDIVIIALIVILPVTLLSMQAYSAVRLFKTDKLERLKLMRACPYCQAPIYKTDKVCPYCKKEVHEES
jgi:hypothetical protein